MEYLKDRSRKMYYEDLPKLDNGNIDFESSIGKEVPFYFEGTKGSVKIVDSFTKENDKGKTIRYLELKNKSKQRLYHEKSFFNCIIKHIALPNKHDSKIGEIVKGYEIIDIINKSKIQKDGSVRSREWFKIKCTNCGMIKLHRIDHLLSRDIRECSDCTSRLKQLKQINAKRSYPERIFSAVLDNLNIKYIQDRATDFSEGKRYDFMFTLNNINYIAEIHGIQHYEESRSMPRFKLTLDEQIKTDKWKKELAIKYGYHYIEINAKYSKFDYIKNSIIKSELPTNNVDWETVYIKSIKVDKDYKTIIRLFNEGLDRQSIIEKSGYSTSYVDKSLKELKHIGEIYYDEYEFEYRYHKRAIKEIEELRGGK